MEIAAISPPIGLNVFVIKSVVGDVVSTMRIFYGVTWYIVADIIVVALLMIFPQIIMWLPTMMK